MRALFRYLGGAVASEIPEPRVDSSFENLRTAMVEERFETDYLYPSFLNTAVPLFDSTAIRSFQWALDADKSHERLFSDAVARLNADAGAQWAHQRHDFFVCALCGYTAQSREAENCPACSLIWERFETIQ